jgi:ethanolamine permease
VCPGKSGTAACDMKVGSTGSRRLHHREYVLTRVNATCLGVVIVWGGFFSSWNEALSAGLGSCLIAVFLVGNAYFHLCVCISTISSVIPFSGGAYGLARCSLGFFPGFVVGCCEMIQYIIFNSIFSNYASEFTCALFPRASSVKALIWSSILISCMMLNMGLSKRNFHRFAFVFAIIEILSLIIYCSGSFRYINFYENALTLRDLPVGTASGSHLEHPLSYDACSSYVPVAHHTWFVGGFVKFISILPFPAMIHVGIEALNMAANETQYPKRDVPQAQMLIMRLLFVFSMIVVFLVASVSPGTQCMSINTAPLNSGLMSIFRGNRAAVWIITMPSLYTSSFGFIWAYSKMLRALADSSLLPTIQVNSNSIIQTTARDMAPIMVGAIVCFILNICMEMDANVEEILLKVALLFAFVAYCSQCFGYLLLSSGGALHMIQDSTYKRLGAVFSLFMWLLMSAGLLGFQDEDHTVLLIFGLILLIITCYYYGYGKMKQTLSNEEKKYLYAMHLLNCMFRPT